MKRINKEILSKSFDEMAEVFSTKELHQELRTKGFEPTSNEVTQIRKWLKRKGEYTSKFMFQKLNTKGEELFEPRGTQMMSDSQLISDEFLISELKARGYKIMKEYTELREL